MTHNADNTPADVLAAMQIVNNYLQPDTYDVYVDGPAVAQTVLYLTGVNYTDTADGLLFTFDDLADAKQASAIANNPADYATFADAHKCLDVVHNYLNDTLGDMSQADIDAAFDPIKATLDTISDMLYDMD